MRLRQIFYMWFLPFFSPFFFKSYDDCICCLRWQIFRITAAYSLSWFSRLRYTTAYLYRPSHLDLHCLAFCKREWNEKRACKALWISDHDFINRPFLSRLPHAWCDVGIWFSVRSSLRASVRPSIFVNTLASTLLFGSPLAEFLSAYGKIQVQI